MKKEDRNSFKRLQEIITDSISNRIGEKSEITSDIIDELINQFNCSSTNINAKIALKNLNDYVVNNIVNSENDHDLFDNSFRINGFGQHIFGSVRNIYKIIDNVYYTLDDMCIDFSDILISMCTELNLDIVLSDSTIHFICALLVDVGYNGLINVDVRMYQHARNIINDVQYIIDYIINKYECTYIAKYKDIVDIISYTTFDKNNIIDAINYIRYEKNKNTDDELNKLNDIDSLFENN